MIASIVHTLIFAFMNILVVLNAFLFCSKLFEARSRVDYLLIWFTLCISQITVIELFLGALGILHLANVIFMHLVFFLIALFIARGRIKKIRLGGLREAAGDFSKNKIILAMASIVLAFGLVKVFINLVNPPFGWDSLNYHFTFPVEWLKYHNLNNPTTIADDPSPTYYPINGSLLYLWLMLPFKSVFLADLGQIPFFVIAFLAVYSISGKFRLGQGYSLLAALLFTLIPNYFKHLKIAYVDAMVAGWFLVCVNWLLVLREDFNRKDALVFGLAFGLLVGTKTVVLPYSVLLLIPFLYLVVARRGWAALGVFIAAAVALGGFVYLRNFVETGNPLYPLDLGKGIFKGVMAGDVYRAHFNVKDYRIDKLLFHEGIGLQSLIFILPGMFLALPLAIVTERKLDFILGYTLLLPLLLYLAYRYCIPLVNTRYIYSLFGVGMVVAFCAFTALKIPKRVVAAIAGICALASLAELAKAQELIASIVLAAALFFILAHLVRRPIMLGAGLMVFVFLLPVFEQDYVKNEYPRYLKMVKYSGFWPDAAKAWDWLNNHTTGNNIAYTGRPVPFPLYGTKFKNNVYYVSVNKTDPVKLHYFPNSRYSWGYDFLSLHQNLEARGNYRGDANYVTWQENLLRRNTDYLFIYSLHQTKEVIFPLEDQWAQSYPAVFNPVYLNKTVHIYRVIR